MRLFSGAAEPQEYGYLYRSICHDVHNKIKQFILFHAAHTITILILVISSFDYRGFGRSSGTLSERGILLDAIAIVN